jgi:hypothetical protein
MSEGRIGLMHQFTGPRADGRATSVETPMTGTQSLEVRVNDRTGSLLSLD